MATGYPEAEYVHFIGAVAETARAPVGIQNNPTNLAVSLSNASLLALARQHPNIRLLKGEGPAVQVARLIAEGGDGYDVFCGHGGRELMTNLRSGCIGLIPAPDAVDVQVRIFAHYAAGTAEGRAEAERLHRSVLPIITFALQSPALMICYGKRILAARIGLGEVRDRAPAIAPFAFGLEEAMRLAADLPQWPG